MLHYKENNTYSVSQDIIMHYKVLRAVELQCYFYSHSLVRSSHVLVFRYKRDKTFHHM